MKKQLATITCLFLCVSSLSFAASYVKTDGTVVDPIQSISGGNHSYSDSNLGPGAYLRYADLRYADLSGADLTGADLSNANLSNADLSNANLSFAKLTGADLSNADLSNADLNGVIGNALISLLNVVQAERDAVIAERDAAVAQLENKISLLNVVQAERDAAVAQLENEYTLTEIADLRPGSSMIAVTGESTTLSMKVEQSIDLIEWTDTEETADAILPAPSGKKFFRFTLAD